MTVEAMNRLIEAAENALLASIIAPAKHEDLYCQEKGERLVRMLGRGLNNTQMARELGISKADLANRLFKLTHTTRIPRHKLVAYGVVLLLKEDLRQAMSTESEPMTTSSTPSVSGAR